MSRSSGRHTMSGGALQGLKVLDLSRILAGPWCTQTLGDLGAEVVKVERPGMGDDTRSWGPPFLSRNDPGVAATAAYFTCANRNKRSIAVDMQHPEGAALLRRMAAASDVLVENFKTGDLIRYGLDYSSVAALNPRLVYCSITGFGQTGPRAGTPGYDYLVQGQGGLMSITGSSGGDPMKVGVAVADLFTGLYAANAILASVLHARETGRGQHIDIALFDTQLAMLANQASNYFVSGISPVRLGNAHPNLAPYQVFTTLDGNLILAVGNDRQFAAACTVLNIGEVAADPRFATNAARLTHRGALTALMTTVFVRRTTAEWIAVLEQVGVPCGPINTIAEAFSDPQAIARGSVIEQIRSDCAEPIMTVASPIHLSHTPVCYERPPPALGEHTRQILEEMGCTEGDIALLVDCGAVTGP